MSDESDPNVTPLRKISGADFMALDRFRKNLESAETIQDMFPEGHDNG